MVDYYPESYELPKMLASDKKIDINLNKRPTHLFFLNA